MRLIDKAAITEFEYQRVECVDSYIVVTLGPYSNQKRQVHDFYRIVNTWRQANGKKQLVRPIEVVLFELKQHLIAFAHNIANKGDL